MKKGKVSSSSKLVFYAQPTRKRKKEKKEGRKKERKKKERKKERHETRNA